MGEDETDCEGGDGAKFHPEYFKKVHFRSCFQNKSVLLGVNQFLFILQNALIKSAKILDKINNKSFLC